MKKYIVYTLFSVLCLLISAGAVLAQEGGAAQQMYESYSKLLSPEKVYLHTDKDVYSATDTIWISGYVENIQILVPDNEKIQKYCNIMIEECDVINTLVQEMLYMSKLESDTFECNKSEFSTEKLAESLMLRTENAFSMENIVFDVENAQINADINLMKRALLNYITNAVKHSSTEGTVEVRGYTEGEYYVFAVSNPGNKISDEEKELIWDVFYKSDQARTRNGGGHGVGLAIVKRIADLHGGKVDLTSENGKNTFYIKIIKYMKRRFIIMITIVMTNRII